jgi:hypothetical protein
VFTFEWSERASEASKKMVMQLSPREQSSANERSSANEAA